MAGMRIRDSGESERNLEYANIIELQAVKFAKEFSVLYKSEKKKRVELEILSAELRERNEELMDILFLTSSQFQEPIKKIDSNFRFIREHAGAQQTGLVEKCDEAQKSVERLHQLLNEMGQLYRTNSARSLLRPVPLDKVLAEVLQNLEGKLGKTRIQVEPLPVLESDNVQLRILFHQLIVLGARFQGPEESYALSIKARRTAMGLWRITFETKESSFVEQNFGLKKCDRRKGLARRLNLCQRIARRLGAFLYGEMVSEDIFSCHVVLPEKKIPPVSQLNDHDGYF
jgi:light-regulated signal transduction histidine kinase (bacteriophytochrome)